MKVMNDKVQPIAKTKKMVKNMFVGWCMLIATVAFLLPMTLMQKCVMQYIYIYIYFFLIYA